MPHYSTWSRILGHAWSQRRWSKFSVSFFIKAVIQSEPQRGSLQKETISERSKTIKKGYERTVCVKAGEEMVEAW
jgi:hypothetical protein